MRAILPCFCCAFLWIAKLTFVIKDDSDDETIDTQDTRHDNGYDGLEDEVVLEDTHGANTNT